MLRTLDLRILPLLLLSTANFPGSHLDGSCFEPNGLSGAQVMCFWPSFPFSTEAGFQPPRYPLIANPFSFSLSRPFIKSLFPENLQADKKGRPTTAGSKIKVCSIWGGRVL